jgi:hypothetical protein
MLGGAPEGWKRTARGQFEHHADATAVMAPPAGEAIGGFVSSVPAAGKAPISAETRPHAVLVNRLGGCQRRPTNQHAVPQELVAAALLFLLC